MSIITIWYIYKKDLLLIFIIKMRLVFIFNKSFFLNFGKKAKKIYKMNLIIMWNRILFYMNE